MRNSLQNERIQKRLRADDKTAMELVYTQYREEFIGFTAQYGLPKEEALDIYQDAIIAMYQNFSVKQVELKSSSIKTYLFGIGKYKIFQHLKIKNQHLPFLESNKTQDWITVATPEDNPQRQLLEKGLSHLSVSCLKVIRLFYYRNLTVDEIVEHTEYKDGNTVRSHKSRCMKKLKELIKSIHNG